MYLDDRYEMSIPEITMDFVLLMYMYYCFLYKLYGVAIICLNRESNSSLYVVQKRILING